jgi:hypothetical protein
MAIVERYFSNLQHSINYGCVPIFADRKSLGIRVQFTSDEPEYGPLKARKSMGDALLPSEMFRTIVSMWGKESHQQCFMLGTISGAIVFFVGDGAGGVSFLVGTSTIFRHHNAGRPYRQLDAIWTPSEMRLWIDGIGMGKATDQTAVKSLPLATSDLTAGAQPGGPFNAPAGMRLAGVEFWDSIASSGRLDPALKGGVRIDVKPPLIADMHFLGDQAVSRQELRGPNGVVLSLGTANFVGEYVPALPIPDPATSAYSHHGPQR